MRVLAALSTIMLLVGVGCGGGGGSASLTLAAVTPASGGVAGGALVTLSGARMDQVTRVTFGGAEATNLTPVDGGTMTCVTPPGTLGLVEVIIEAGDDTSTLAGFTYYPVPTLTMVTDPLGSLVGGETLTLTGSGFLVNEPGIVSVTIGDVPATAVNVSSDSQLTCVSGGQTAPGNFDVQVHTQNGTATLAAGFQAVLPPTLTAVATNAGPAGGYTDVTLTGTNLDGGVQGITFDGAAATHIVPVDATTVTCRTPPGTEGAVDVAITTYGGSASMADAYTYTVWAPSDPLYNDQWHLNNTGQTSPSTADEDARTVGAWDLGYTGQGVRIAVVDDGLELLHEDLVDNIVAGANWDYGDDDNDPTRERHGTSVAGVSAAVGGNDLGGTGAAPNAQLVGFAVLTGGVSNAEFADALARDHVDNDIYNNSWGSPLLFNAILYGFSAAPASFHNAVDTALQDGRDGYGSVYFKSAGNSGATASCCYDGTNGVRGVNVIGSVDTDGQQSSYSQDGPCILVCAPSNNAGHAGITTADRTGSAGYASGNYTSGFGGTSSACPLVSGVAALVLEARPQLAWWEVSLVLALSARRNDTNHPDWVQNGAGHWVNEQYGFGVVNAEEAVKLARNWVPRAGLVSDTRSQSVNSTVTAGDATGVSSTITVPDDTGITNLHTATVTVTMTHARSTDLTVILTSPDGTVSRFVRSLTYGGTIASNSISGIPMVSRRHLGETVDGDWTLQIVEGQNNISGTWASWELVLEGEGTTTTTLRASKASRALQLRPAAPALTDASQVTWWNGRAWQRAQVDASQVAAWNAEFPAEGAQDALGARILDAGRLRIWQLAEGVDASALFAARGGVVPARQRVYRDGPAGDGALRVLTGRVVVHWAFGLDDATRVALERQFGLEAVPALSRGGQHVYTVGPTADPLTAARALLESASVRSAAPDWWQPRRSQ